MDYTQAIQTLIEENKRYVQKYGVTKRSIDRDTLINALLDYVHSSKKQLEECKLKRQRYPYLLEKFSFYTAPIQNLIPYYSITLRTLYETIKNDFYKERTEKLRQIVDIKEARKFKAAYFDYVTFSGTFSKRDKTCLIQHSNMLVIDFDHVEDIPALKDRLLNDDYFVTLLMFRSPSGDGLKWIIPIDAEQHSHDVWFRSISAYIEQTYGIKADSSGSDIARACFLCYDPDCYINPILL